MLERTLKLTLEKLALELYGKEAQLRWVDAYFPFTHPSWELEVFFNGDWIELLGCGVMEQRLLRNAGAGSRVRWAFGLGLERIAMPLFSIDDIRLFWSEDPAFVRQFEGIDPMVSEMFPPKFVPFPDYPAASYDISFWVKNKDDVTGIKSDFGDLARTIVGDSVEEVNLIDQFEKPKSDMVSAVSKALFFI